MKKKTLFFLLSTACIGSIYAQNGNGNSGNAGINNSWKLNGNESTDPSSQYLGTSDNQSLVFRTNALERLRILSSGYVGIGTTTPSVPLEVAGNIYLNKALAQNHLFAFNNDPTKKSIIQVLNGNGMLPKSIGIRAWGSNMSTDGMEEAGQGGILTQNMRMNIGTYTEHALSFWTNNVKRMTISASGQVGIGTNTPGAQLTVVGTIESTSGGIKFPDGSVQTSAYIASNQLGTQNNPYDRFFVTDFVKVGQNSLYLGSNSTGSTPGTGEYIYTTSAPLVINEDLAGQANYGNVQNTVINPNGGNVGIGQRDPKALLDLHLSQDYMSGSAYGHRISYNNAPLPLGGTPLQNSSIFEITQSNSGNTDFIVKRRNQGTAFVGLGTNAPRHKLHVTNGNLLLEGSASSGNLLFGKTTGAPNGEWAFTYDDVNHGLEIFKPIGAVIQGHLPNALFMSDRGGYIGLGTDKPIDALHIKGGGIFVDNGHNGVSFNDGSEIDDDVLGQYRITYLGGIHNALYIGKPENSTDNKGDLLSKPQHVMIMDDDGKVGIGVHPNENNQEGYRLNVLDGIRTEKVKVQLENQWADYVFDENYELKSLEDVEQFIKTHKHLPGVPSAKQVDQEGVELGDMTRILMEKVEELTLHMIELKKENEELKKLVKKQ
ncbi:MAG: hypothetical protein EP338_14215 [Bacteroidetes bacterium]|nr:MAG: hypothetical protein EP338_14215 [Bacteroidota bacterium]